jgi:Fe-S-cluster-containing dehydrogenase component
VLVDEDKCIGCKLCSWACPYGAREFDADVGVMKKCTLCVDRIYNERTSPRPTACRPASPTCPTSARHFGDLGDPTSAVSKLVAERGGYGADAGTRLSPGQPLPAAAREGTGFLGWLDRLLSH